MSLNFKEIAYKEIATQDTESVLTTVASAKRHVIKINNIHAERSQHATRSMFQTGELITEPVDRIAVFASEIIPDHFQGNDWINYRLTVNGKDYEVVPVNSHRVGTKIIKNLSFDMDTAYSVNIKEEIKSAYLTVSIGTPNQYETPFLSNLKILYGKKGEKE